MDTPITAKAALLQVLLEGPAHGFALIERVGRRTQGCLVLSEGSAYPALRRLEDDKMILGREEPAESDRGGRPRRIYTVTALGRRVAEDHREQVAALFGLADTAETKKGRVKR